MKTHSPRTNFDGIIYLNPDLIEAVRSKDGPTDEYDGATIATLKENKKYSDLKQVSKIGSYKGTQYVYSPKYTNRNIDQLKKLIARNFINAYPEWHHALPEDIWDNKYEGETIILNSWFRIAFLHWESCYAIGLHRKENENMRLTVEGEKQVKTKVDTYLEALVELLQKKYGAIVTAQGEFTDTRTTNDTDTESEDEATPEVDTLTLEHTIKFIGKQCSLECPQIEYEHRPKLDGKARHKGYYCKLFGKCGDMQHESTLPKGKVPKPRRLEDCIIAQTHKN